jgi:hypothetical protein
MPLPMGSAGVDGVAMDMEEASLKFGGCLLPL